MATRARLSHTVIVDTDTNDKNISPNQAVYVYELDGVTLLGQSMYAGSSGGSPLTNPLHANSEGVLIAYAAVAQRCIVKVNTVAYATEFAIAPNKIEASSTQRVEVDAVTGTAVSGNLSIIGPRPFIDCFGYGAVGDGVKVIGNGSSTGASITSGQTALTLAGGAFTSADVGKAIRVVGAGAAGASLTTTITGFTNSTHVTIGLAASTTVAFHSVHYGTNETSAIQAAIDFAKTNGGGGVYLRAGRHITTAAIAWSFATDVTGIELYGDGPGVTIIDQITDVADVLQVGAPLVAGTTNQHIRDLTTEGGRFGVLFDNTLVSVMRRTSHQDHDIGIYGIGTNELMNLSRIEVDGCTEGGIIFGGLNGGNNSTGTDLPELAKSRFEHILVSGTTAGPGIKITAGKIGAGPQQASVANTFTDINLQNNAADQFWLEYAYGTVIENISNEIGTAGVLVADNTYSGIKIGTGCSSVLVKNAYMAPATDDLLGTLKYSVEALSGLVVLDHCNVAVHGAAGTKDLYIGAGVVLEARDVIVTSAAANIQVTTNLNTLLVNPMGPGLAPITDFASGVPWIGRGAHGLRTGNLGVGKDPDTYPFEVNGSTRLKHAVDVGLIMDGGDAAAQLITFLLRNSVLKWTVGLSADVAPKYQIISASGGTAVAIDYTTGVVSLPLGVTAGGTFTAGGTIQAKNPTQAGGSSTALTNSFVDAPGNGTGGLLAVTLTPGKWIVRADMYFAESGAGDVGVYAQSQLVLASGTVAVAIPGFPSGPFVNMAASGITYYAGYTWIVNVTGTAVVKMQIDRSSGSGASTMTSASLLTAANA